MVHSIFQKNLNILFYPDSLKDKKFIFITLSYCYRRLIDIVSFHQYGEIYLYHKLQEFNMKHCQNGQESSQIFYYNSTFDEAKQCNINYLIS